MSGASAPEPELRGGGAARCAGRQGRGGTPGGRVWGSVTSAGAGLVSVIFLLVLLLFNSLPSPRSFSFTSF